MIVLSFERMPELSLDTGREPPRIYEDIKAGLMVKPVKLGARASGWPRHEVRQVIAARIAGKSDDEIRALVVRLHALRLKLLDEVA